MSVILAPVPFRDAPLKDGAPEQGKRILSSARFSDVLVSWLNDLRTLLNAAPKKLKTVSLTAQDAAIATTAVPLGANLPEGLYRVSWRLRVTRAATSSSSVGITLGHTEGGVALTAAAAALTGNTTATHQSGSVLLFIDAQTDITYAVSYSTSGATTMLFRLDLAIERIPA